MTGDSFVTASRTIGVEDIMSREVDDETELEEHRWRVLNQDGRMVLRMNVEVVCRRARALAT